MKHTTSLGAGRPLGSRKQAHPPVPEARAIVRACWVSAIDGMPTQTYALEVFLDAYRSGLVGGDATVLEPAVRAIEAILTVGAEGLRERSSARRDAAVCTAFDRIRELRVDPTTGRFHLSEAECDAVVAQAFADEGLWPKATATAVRQIEKRRSSS